jgi:leucyl/phenylalanyl-tRNA--protein transferase
MFSRRSDASKVALSWLVARLKVGNFTLLDCQFMTDHLASLGAVSIPREAYVALLSAALGGGGSAASGGAATVLVDARTPPPEAPPDFAALDRLLEVTGAAGAAGPAGYVISQLLGQTS